MGSKGGGGGGSFDPEEMFRAAAHYNRLNQYTPWGSVEYSGPGNTTVTETMSPAAQSLMESRMGLQGSALSQLLAMFGGSPMGLGGGGDTGVERDPYVPFSTYQPGGGWTGGQPIWGDHKMLDLTGGKAGKQDRGLAAAMASSDGGVTLTGGGQLGVASPAGGGGGMEWNPGEPWTANPFNWGEDIASDLDLGSLPGITGMEDLMGLRGKLESSLFERGRGLLDPVFEEREAIMNERLANRGLPIGSEIYEDETARFDRAYGDAMNRLAQESIIGGGEEMARQLGMETGVRGQSLSERLAQLGAINQARGQGFGEYMGQRGQGFGEYMGQRGQGFQEYMGQRGQLFNELASILGLSGTPTSAGSLGGFYGPGQVDTMGGFNLAAQQQAANQGFWSDLFGGLLGLGGQLGGAYLGRG